jgi:hypothetical protein
VPLLLRLNILTNNQTNTDHRSPQFVPQADMAEANVASESQNSKHQTMVFADGSPEDVEYIVKTGVDKTRSSRDSSDVGLSEFLSRPIKIDTKIWNVTGDIHHTINPWSLFFANKRVSNRITNYNLLRCNLKLKFVINGNGFYYGKAIASYLPLAFYDELSRNRSAVTQDVIQASQQPHIYLDPTTSTGGVLTLPFFYFRDYMNLTDAHWNQMGEVCLRSMNELQHCNGGTDPISISIFAWAEDVSLSVPTSLNMSGLIPQAGMDEIDEANAKGFISGPATAMAKTAKSLQNIPALTSYATTAEAALKMTAAAAKLLGYARPPVTKSPDPFLPANMSSLANVTVPDMVNKLTVDDKQALGMGSDITGVESSDPLTIASIAGRESYLTTFTWPTSATTDQLLFNIRVHPTLHDVDSSGVQDALHLTAMAVAAAPFEYWTGTINVRFQIVASAYHKGRLRVAYDPNYMDLTPEFNVNHQEIVDITEKQDFTMSVSNSQETGIISTITPGRAGPNDLFSTSRFTDWVDSNGVIAVYVLNELVTPNSALPYDAQVNVFVSAGEDFKVFSPNDEIRHYNFFPQSDFLPQADVDIADTAQASVMPVDYAPEPLNSSGPMVDEITRVYAGEQIASFRSLMKRYVKHSTLGALGGPGGLNVHNYIRTSFPYMKGPAPGAVDASVDGPWNYCNTSLLQFITMGFSGWRGGIRAKVIPLGVATDTTVQYEAHRSLSTTAYANPKVSLTAVTDIDIIRYNGLNTFGVASLNSGASGSTITTSVVNDVLSFETPFQLKYRFVPAKVADQTISDPWSPRFSVTVVALASNRTRLEIFTAAGEDFQVYFWTGMPPLHYDNTPPLPVQ